MYILTTAKRVRQITALVIVAAVFVIVFIGYRTYQANVTLPEQLRLKLMAVAKGKQTLDQQDVNQQALAAQERERVKASLLATLQASNHPDAQMGVKLLLGDATGYLNDAVLFSHWINYELTQINAPGDTWLIDSSQTGRHLITAGRYCLIIEKQPEHWQLSSLEVCAAGNGQAENR